MCARPAPLADGCHDLFDPPQSLGEDYAERVIPSIGNEILKSIVAQFDAEELITQREVRLRWRSASHAFARPYFRTLAVTSSRRK